MIHLKCNQATFFDVDDTLVMWHKASPGDPRAVEIKCPVSRHKQILDENGIETGDVVVEKGIWTEWLIPHTKHIEQIKAHKFRGHTIVVWSAGGDEWARAVVDSLGLAEYVDLIIAKPTWHYDDLPAEEFMGKRHYLKNE